MADMTLEKVHALLQQLAEYVMQKMPVLEQKLARLETQLASLDYSKAGREDVKHVEEKVNYLINIMDAQAKKLDDVQTEQIAQLRTLDVYNERIGDLEETILGHRVREDE